MITSLLIMAMLRFRRRHPQLFEQFLNRFLRIARQMILIILAVCTALYAKGQERQLAYSVKRHGEEIGSIILSERRSPQKSVISLESKMVAKMIFRFNIVAREEAVFEDGRLMYSSVYRAMNEKEKANHQIRSGPKGYVLEKNNRTTFLTDIPITCNTLLLYLQEPQGNSVFSDKFQRFLPVQKTGQGRYRVEFPDGYSIYQYDGGVCVNVKVNTSLYSASLELIR